jgi:heme O synthase-like polyprenyltransferase
MAKRVRFASSQVFASRAPFEPKVYLDLTKSKLTVFVLLTTIAGYTIAPGFNTLPVLFLTTAGTGLQIACANTMNQVAERITTPKCPERGIESWLDTLYLYITPFYLV